MKRTLYFLLITLICYNTKIFSQSINSKPDSLRIPHETFEGEYIPLLKKDHITSIPYYYRTDRFFTAQVNVDSNRQNIVGDAANEPSIAVDPNNSDRMAIGWRYFETIESSFRQAGYGFTTDEGNTWNFPGIIDRGNFRSDPVLDSDSEGNFYYNSLSNDLSCTVYKSTDGGVSWDSGTSAYGGDKAWMTIDKTGGVGNGNIYAFWAPAFSTSESGYFSRSVDNGENFSPCIYVPYEIWHGTLAVGPVGELYLCGRNGNGFSVSRSSNAKFSDKEVVWDLGINVDLDGTLQQDVLNSPNPDGLLGQAWIAVDNSDQASRGNVYLLCSVNRNSIVDPLDVMFARSTNGGETWSEPVRVNDDSTNNAWQWFGTMSIAPNGRIDVVWLDTRDDPDGFNSALFYSYSVDEGMTWSVNEKLSESFDPHLGWPKQNKMGDYFDMVSENDKVHLAWAATFNGEQDVYYGQINPEINVTVEEKIFPKDFVLHQNYPNPFNPSTTIKYAIPSNVKGETSNVKLIIYDVLGREVATLVNEQQKAGYYEVNFNASSLTSGIYFYHIAIHSDKLNVGSFVETKKMILLR